MHPNTTPAKLLAYSAAGTNTIVEVSDNPTTLTNISVEQFGGSGGWLQIYNNGTKDATAGSPDLAYGVGAGTFTAGTPATRDLIFPGGLGLNKGASYLWAAGATGTVAHGVNARVTIIGNSLSSTL